MARPILYLTTAMLLLAAPGLAQSTAPNAQRALQAAAENMGVADLKSIQYSGNGYIGAVGQNFSPDQDWPRFDMTGYTRTIDFDTNSSKEEITLRQGNNPARGGGGTPIAGEQKRLQFASGGFAWDQRGNAMVPLPGVAEKRQLEIYLTPFGFLKGAMASNATAITRNEYGGRVTVVSFLAFGKYRVNGTINADNVVQRVQTWIPSPVAGDLYYENVYTNYKEIGGMKLPMRWHQHNDYDDGGQDPNVSGGDHSFDLETLTSAQKNIANAALQVPLNVESMTVAPERVVTTKMADGVWLLGGGTHNSLLVEFKDYVTLIEAPLNEERSVALLDEIYRLVPNKPVRFLINTHHHWDHLGGVRTLVHEGATVVTYEGNVPYYREILTPARRWTLKPDRFFMNPPEEWSEGYIFETVREKYILGDDMRTIEIHHVPGLAHAAGMLIAYLPKEKIVVEADLYTPPEQGQAAAPLNASNRTFQNTLKTLKLDVQTIVPIHGRPGSMAEFTQFMSR